MPETCLTGASGLLLYQDPTTAVYMAILTAGSMGELLRVEEQGSGVSLDMTIDVATSGTFIFQFAQANVNALASTLLKYSTIQAIDVPA